VNGNAPLLLDHDGTNYAYLPGLSGNYLGVTDSADLDITGDLDVRVLVMLDDWDTGAEQTLIAKFTNLSANRSWQFRVGTTGALQLVTSADGTTILTHTSSVVPTLFSGVAYWLRATIDVASGSDRVVQFFQAPFSATTPVAWTQIGTTITTAGTTSIFNGAAPLTLGSINAGLSVFGAGRFYRAQVLNGISGTVVLDTNLSTMITTGSETAMLSTGPGSPIIPEPSDVLPNLGWGGFSLNARYGSAVGPDTNDPLLLQHTGTNYVFLPGVTGNYLSMVSDTSNAFTTEVDYIVRMDRLWAGAGTNGGVIGRYGASSGANVALLNSDGTINFTLHDGTAYVTVACSAKTSGDGARWFRVTWRSSDGRVQFFFNADQSTVPTVWTQLGVDATLAAGATIAQSAQEFFIGGSSTTGFAPCKVLYASAAKTIGGVPTVLVDTSVITTGAATSFTATTGQTVTINRSTSGRKAVAVVQPTILFGTDDYMEVADNALLNFGADDSFTVMAAGRYWNTQGTNDTLVAKKANTTNTTLGWSLTNGSSTALNGQTQIGDGTLGLTATSASRTVGAVATTTMVRDVTTDQVTVYTDTTAGTPVTDTTTGTLANAEVVRIGRLSGAGTEYADMEFFGAAVWRRALTAGEIATVNAHYQSGPTTASTALLGEAVLWLDPSQRRAMTLNRASAGRRSVAVPTAVWSLGTDDYFEVPDSVLLDMGAGQDFTALVIQRPWWLQGSSDTLVAKVDTTTVTAQGWAVSNPTTGDALRTAGRIGDGSAGAEAFGAQRLTGQRQAAVLVRSGGTLTSWTGGAAGTPVAATTGDLSNGSVMRIGRLSGAGTEYLDSEIRAVAVWRRALTTAEITAVLNYYGAA
jgi:hypothetical protein